MFDFAIVFELPFLDFFLEVFVPCIFALLLNRNPSQVCSVFCKKFVDNCNENLAFGL